MGTAPAFQAGFQEGIDKRQRQQQLEDEQRKATLKTLQEDADTPADKVAAIQAVYHKDPGVLKQHVENLTRRITGQQPQPVVSPQQAQQARIAPLAARGKTPEQQAVDMTQQQGDVRNKEAQALAQQKQQQTFDLIDQYIKDPEQNKSAKEDYVRKQAGITGSGPKSIPGAAGQPYEVVKGSGKFVRNVQQADGTLTQQAMPDGYAGPQAKPTKPLYKVIRNHAVLIDPNTGSVLKDLGLATEAKTTTRQTAITGADGTVHIVPLTSVMVPGSGSVDVEMAPDAGGGETATPKGPAPKRQVINAYKNPEDEPPAQAYSFNQQWSKPGPYVTGLSPQEEQQFQQWVKANNVPWKDTPNSDYDMRGYWQALRQGKAKQELNSWDHKMHFPDTWKTPYSGVFSGDSMYAMPGAPKWNGDVLKTADGRVVVDETPSKGPAPRKQATPPGHPSQPKSGGDKTLPFVKATPQSNAANKAVDTAENSYLDVQKAGANGKLDPVGSQGVVLSWLRGRVNRVTSTEISAVRNLGGIFDKFDGNMSSLTQGTMSPKQYQWFLRSAKDNYDNAKQVAGKYGSPAPKASGGGGKQDSQKPVVQHSASTGQYRYSTDGGTTWQPGLPPCN